MATKLEEIVSHTRLQLAGSNAFAAMKDLEAEAAHHKPRGFRTALQRAARSGVAIIAELKKASPSKGLIRADFSVEDLAAELEEAGAAALSVLTNAKYFLGSLRNLEIASESTTIPCLRKDFIVEEVQLVEARAHGADAVLLIVAALSQAELTKLHARARDLKLDVLCEVHDAMELQRALDVGCDTIGVNNRDLHTFKVDLNTSLQLSELIPAGVLKVAESGIATGKDIARLREAGFDAFLIGESLMAAEYPGEALRELMAGAVESE